MSLPTLVQRSTPKCTGASASAAMTSDNFASAVTSGDLLLTLIRTGGGTPNTPTDTIGTVYRLIKTVGTNPLWSAWYGIAPATGTNATTVTLTSATYWGFVTWQYHGQGKAPIGYNFSTTGTGTTACTLSSITTTSADELLITCVSQSALATYTTADSGTLKDDFVSGAEHFGATSEYAPGAIVSGYSAAFTSTVTNGYTMLAISITGGNRLYYAPTWFGSNEHIRAMSTDDGLTFFDYLPVATYTPTSPTGACRNLVAHLNTTDGYTYIIHSDSSEYTSPAWILSTHISIARSLDGVTYSPYAWLDYASVGSFGAGVTIWAGNWFIDDDGSEHYIFAASPTGGGGSGTFSIFEIHPTVAHVYSAWSTPVAFAGSAIPAASHVDPFLTKIGSTYYLFFQQNDSANHQIYVLTSTSQLTGYNTVLHNGNWCGYSSDLAFINDQPVLQIFGAATRIFADWTAGQESYVTQLTGDWKSGGATTWSAPTAPVRPTGTAQLRALAFMSIPATASSGKFANVFTSMIR